MYKIWYFEKRQPHACDYCMHKAATICPGSMDIFSKFGKMRWEKYWQTKIYDWPLDFVYKRLSDHPLSKLYFKRCYIIFTAKNVSKKIGYLFYEVSLF